MKRLVLLLLSSVAFGQGVVLPPQQALKVVNGVMSPIPNATVTVCAANTSGLPCSPPLVGAIFKDAALTQPLSNPFTADANGNYQFAIASGNYTVTATGAGFTGYSYQISTTCPPSISCTWTGNQSFTGSLTVSGNFTVNGGQNSLNFFKHNGIVWAGPESLKYLTLDSSLTDAQCSSVPGACENQLSSNFSETSTSTITVGNAANTLINHVHGYPGAKFTCNVTSGSPCFQMNGPSGFSGDVVSSSSGGANGGFLFTYPSTANFSCLFCTPTAQVGGTSYESLRNLFVYGNATATVPAVADMVAVNNLPIFENFYFANFPSIGMNVRSGSASSAVAGPFVFTNVWMDGFNNAGARPWVFTSDATSHNSIGNLNIFGGVANHAGSGRAMVEFTGNSAGSATMKGANIIGQYCEDLAVSSGTLCYKMSDVHAFHFSGVTATPTANGTVFDINQSGAGRTCAIALVAINESSPGNTATFINNHITGFTTTGPDLPFYVYGGDSSCSTVPFTVESLPAVFSAVGNAAIGVPIGEITSKFSGATLHGIVEVDTEASGKTVGFGPGSAGVGRFSFIDTSDSNTELMSCSLSTTSVCGMRSVVIGTSNGSSAATTAAGESINTLLDAAASPTITAAGCGGAAAAIVNPNGTAAFQINVGTTPTAGGCTVTMPTAGHGWACQATDITTQSASVFLVKQVGAGSTTSVNLQNFSDTAVATAPTASDIWNVQCRGF